MRNFLSSEKSAMNTVTLSKVVLKKCSRILEKTKKKDGNKLKEGKRRLIFLKRKQRFTTRKTKEHSLTSKGTATNNQYLDFHIEEGEIPSTVIHPKGK